MTFDEGPVVLGNGEGETIQGPAGGPLTFKVRGAQTDGALTAIENVVAPGDGPPLHTHEREGESWYVLEGSLRFKLGSEIRSAPAGSFVFVPAGTPHCFQNVGDTPARCSSCSPPPGWRRSSTGSQSFQPAASIRECSQRSGARSEWRSSAHRSPSRTRSSLSGDPRGGSSGRGPRRVG